MNIHQTLLSCDTVENNNSQTTVCLMLHLLSYFDQSITNKQKTQPVDQWWTTIGARAIC